MKISTFKLIQRLYQSTYLRSAVKDNYVIDLISVDQVIDDSKVSDHHAIIPTADLLNTPLSVLSKDEKNILIQIVNRLFLAVYTPYSYIAKRVTVSINDYDFFATGRLLISAGFKIIEKIMYDNLPELNDIYLSQIEKGDVIKNIEVRAEEKKTKPIRPYTDSSLLSAMVHAGRYVDDKSLKKFLKDGGLGTPATRASIIEHIINNGYVVRRKRYLVPTEKAFLLVDALPDALKNPKLTAEWERSLLKIASGKLKKIDFDHNIHNFIETTLIKELETVKNNKKYIGACPRCGSSVEIMSNKYACSDPSCQFTMWKSDYFFQNKKIIFDEEIAAALLCDGHVFVENMYSKKADKLYDAYIVLNDDGEKVKYNLKFD